METLAPGRLLRIEGWGGIWITFLRFSAPRSCFVTSRRLLWLFYNQLLALYTPFHPFATARLREELPSVTLEQRKLRSRNPCRIWTSEGRALTSLRLLPRRCSRCHEQTRSFPSDKARKTAENCNHCRAVRNVWCSNLFTVHHEFWRDP